MSTQKYTPGPWGVVKSHGGWFLVTRTWTSGLYQRMRGCFATEQEALAAISKVGGAA